MSRLLDKHRWPLDARRRLQDRVRPYGTAAEQAAEKLIDGLRPLLHDLADYRQKGGTGTLFRRAAELKRPEIPPGFQATEWDELIREVLRQSGVLVERSDDFMFVHQSVQEYLAACRRAEQHPDPSKRSSKWLPPAGERWPWPDAEVTIFLAEIWISRRQDISRPLARLMRRRNRTRNAPFIAELAAHGTSLPSKIRVRATDALTTTIKSPSTARNDWLTAVRYLISLDQNYAIATLAEVATGRARNSQASSYRRVEAAQIVQGIDPASGLPLLEMLAADKSADSFDRLRAARAVAEVDPARGMTCLTALIKDPTIDQHGYREGARALGELDRGQAMITLSRAAAGQETDVEERIRAVQALGDLGYAEYIRPQDQTMAITALHQFAIQATTTADDCIRVARVISRLDQEQAIAVLSPIASDPRRPLEDRIRVARVIAELSQEQAIAVLSPIASDPRRPLEDRIRVARAIIELDRQQTIAVLSPIASHPDMPPDDRIPLLEELGTFGHFPSVEQLAAMAGNLRLRPSQRVRASQVLAKFDQESASRTLTAISADENVSESTRIMACEVIIEFDQNRGLGLLENLSQDVTADDSLRIRTAEALHQNHRQRGEKALNAIALDHKLTSSTRVQALTQLEAKGYPNAAQLRKQLRADGTIANYNRQLEEDRKAAEIQRRQLNERIRQQEQARRRQYPKKR